MIEMQLRVLNKHEVSWHNNRVLLEVVHGVKIFGVLEYRTLESLEVNTGTNVLPNPSWGPWNEVHLTNSGLFTSLSDPDVTSQ